MSPRSNRKPVFGQRSTSKKHVTSMSCRLEPAIWSCDTCFDRCQLLITWMSNIKELHSKPRLHVFCQPIIWSMGAMLRDSTVAVVVRKCKCKCKFNVKHRECLCNHPSQRHILTSNAAAHDNHEKINSWVSFCLYG